MAAIKVNYTNGPVGKAIDLQVNATMAEGKGTLAACRAFVEACWNGHASPDNARAILTAINAKLQKARTLAHDPRKVATLKASRISEFKSILRLSEYACWPTVFDYFKGMDVNREMLKVVSKFVREKVKGDAKKNAKAAPSRDAIMRKLNERKLQRRGAGGHKNGKNTNAPIIVTNGERTLMSVLRQVKGLKKWWSDDKGNQFIVAMIKAAEQAKPLAKNIVKARKAAKEEVDAE
jgi:hypothetical protein